MHKNIVEITLLRRMQLNERNGGEKFAGEPGGTMLPRTLHLAVLQMFSSENPIESATCGGKNIVKYYENVLW
jgi:hypothetical protein